MSSVICHMSMHLKKKILQSFEANQGRVCYQKGLPHLVFDNVQIKADFQIIHSKERHPEKKSVSVCVLSEVEGGGGGGGGGGNF